MVEANQREVDALEMQRVAQLQGVEDVVTHLGQCVESKNDTLSAKEPQLAIKHEHAALPIKLAQLATERNALTESKHNKRQTIGKPDERNARPPRMSWL